MRVRSAVFAFVWELAEYAQATELLQNGAKYDVVMEQVTDIYPAADLERAIVVAGRG